MTHVKVLVVRLYSYFDGLSARVDYCCGQVVCGEVVHSQSFLLYDVLQGKALCKENDSSISVGIR